MGAVVVAVVGSIGSRTFVRISVSLGASFFHGFFPMSIYLLDTFTLGGVADSVVILRFYVCMYVCMYVMEEGATFHRSFMYDISSFFNLYNYSFGGCNGSFVSSGNGAA